MQWPLNMQRSLTAMVTLLTLGVLAPLPVSAEASEKPLVLVELFTSEGCSSCPPADRLLSTFQKGQPIEGVTVVPLSFHVDYWDYLGWKDPFGARAYSQRQRDYARISKDDRVYTPQMIVNGTVGFVGSDASRARVAIKNAAADEKTGLTIAMLEKQGAGSLTVSIAEALQRDSSDELWVALAEDDLSSEVTRGENRGKTLVHQGVVRSFSKRALGDAVGPHVIEVPFDASWKKENSRVVAVIQDEKTGEVRSLGQLSLGASE